MLASDLLQLAIAIVLYIFEFALSLIPVFLLAFCGAWFWCPTDPEKKPRLVAPKSEHVASWTLTLAIVHVTLSVIIAGATSGNSWWWSLITAVVVEWAVVVGVVVSVMTVAIIWVAFEGILKTMGWKGSESEQPPEYEAVVGDEHELEGAVGAVEEDVIQGQDDEVTTEGLNKA